MRRVIVLALAATALAAPAPAQRSEPEGQSVTVTGNRIQSYRDRLAACLARHCPVNEDVDATLALAEVLFIEGDYTDARRAVQGSLRRNRDAAAAFPEPVSDLYRVDGRLARHMGLDRQARTSTGRILTTLQTGIPREDHRHFTARLEMAEVQMLSGNYEGAKRELEALATSARANGREDVAVMAELRAASYQLTAFPEDARDRLLTWSALAGPENRLRATGARVLLSRYYRSQGDIARADALLGAIGRNNAGARRRLLYSPAYALAQQEVTGGVNNDLYLVSTSSNMTRLTDNMENGWVDVGFWVSPEGTVSGIEILRHGADTSWSRPLVAAMQRRRYSAGPEATYRIERYTYTSAMTQRSGTRLQMRSPAGRVEYFDLSEGATPPPPPPAQPS
jgi:ATP/maltotriose-dependent transcriptional regulator MalT